MNRLFWPVAISVLTASSSFAFEPQPAPDPADPTAFFAQMGGGSFLGVAVQEIDADRAKALRLKDEHGVEVTRVEDDSPAAKAGMKVGDVALEYNNERVEGTEQFIRLVRETPAGRDVKILVSRGGATSTVIAKIGIRKAFAGKGLEGFRFEMPNAEEFHNIPVPDIPKAYMSWRSGMLGVEAESVDGQLGQYFGVKDGVLIRSVTKDSVAEKTGIKAGDVLTKVDGTAVSTPSEVTTALRSRHGKGAVPITLTRDHREIALTVNLEPEKTGGDGVPLRKISIHARELM
jgi:serine protease Do